MFKHICSVTTLRLPLEKAQVLPFIWDIQNIEYCEVKADKVRVVKETEKSGTYTVKGHFMHFIPWTRQFRYELHDRGFHSQEAAQPPSSLNIQGGFFVETTGRNECEIFHYEQYTLPPQFFVLKPVIFLYLKWSQKREMNDLKKLILARTGTGPNPAKSIESPGLS
jgi:hypothetical protein